MQAFFVLFYEKKNLN